MAWAARSGSIRAGCAVDPATCRPRRWTAGLRWATGQTDSPGTQVSSPSRSRQVRGDGDVPAGMAVSHRSGMRAAAQDEGQQVGPDTQVRGRACRVRWAVVGPGHDGCGEDDDDVLQVAQPDPAGDRDQLAGVVDVVGPRWWGKGDDDATAGGDQTAAVAQQVGRLGPAVLGSVTVGGPAQQYQPHRAGQMARSGEIACPAGGQVAAGARTGRTRDG